MPFATKFMFNPTLDLMEPERTLFGGMVRTMALVSRMMLSPTTWVHVHEITQVLYTLFLSTPAKSTNSIQTFFWKGGLKRIQTHTPNNSTSYLVWYVECWRLGEEIIYLIESSCFWKIHLGLSSP